MIKMQDMTADLAVGQEITAKLVQGNQNINGIISDNLSSTTDGKASTGQQNVDTKEIKGENSIA